MPKGPVVERGEGGAPVPARTILTTPPAHASTSGAAQAHPAVAPPPPSPADRGGSLDRVVFGVAAVVALAFVAWGFASPQGLGSVSGTALEWVETNLGWLFVLLASAFVVYVIWLAAGKYGRIPLGRDDEAPEFRTVSWVAMMFSAGMGIGLMFFGVSEPLSHYVSPPPGTVAAETPEALQTALATTLFHWSLHPWAIYAVVGLAIAYGTFRRGRRQLFSAAFAPLFGRQRTEGPAGKVIDVLAIFATLFGSAASLGLGALQIGSGMEILGWAGDLGNGLFVLIIAVLTAAFVASAVSGIAKGIQWLANTNMVLAVVLAVFVFVVGPTIFILNLLPAAIGNYFADLGEMAARTEASGGDATAEWLRGWTVFYWAWWISWTPFVGLFIARISRGRTIRQFVTGVLLVPSVVSLVWFAVFGGAGIAAQRSGADVAGQATAEGQLFGVLETFPLATVMTVLVMLLVGGDEALTGLQNLTIIAALPFALVMAGLAVALARDVRSDPVVLRRTAAAEAVEQAVVDGITRHGEDFVLVVEPAPDADRDGIPDTAIGTTPRPAAEHRGSGGDRTVRDVGSPIPDAGARVPDGGR
ncbi:BCCT family transporter [Geodermatophilus obscurus]|uniref:Choline/carnitine/betaine transporter n=1 Tax=Geodermatophilus obscurus (strain ATCC 25078 / DSM 43160 / JCM 3152 / CCUG 61914 / KCC A-0152 / KCTC 9177 / NBRC 13315 / NRRL B-3577 / G-20) TaxID=526225 RepID=D2S6T7_GEOOG|nr:BCCT family transporter [Geodermatophilus obscurus]ADB77429.1 choline/carnitine/betaine transporter [Geodermatophilus obscurus DSM 43160]